MTAVRHTSEPHPGAAVFTLGGQRFEALPSGALWWPGQRLLAVADLHLGRAERTARLGSGLIPPYETLDTLARLDVEIARTDPAAVLSLGDAFDDAQAARALSPEARNRLEAMVRERRWLWVAGNHDPGGNGLGECAKEIEIAGITFRHEAVLGASAPEVSAHYHPKATLRHRGQRIVRRCFFVGGARAILPAFGTFTGGLDVGAAALARFASTNTRVLLTGERITALPFARVARRG
ncbi:MAG: ligase-associated DNA damage response endonuclease PdeM [Pseudomonadota bacterium]